MIDRYKLYLPKSKREVTIEVSGPRNKKNILFDTFYLLDGQNAFRDSEDPEMGAVQKLQNQNSLTNGESWILLPFRELYEKAIRSSKYSEIMKVAGKYLFKIDRYAPYIENVVNFPMICAVYTYRNNDTEWLQPQYRLAIKSFLNFNENYYIKTYKIASEIIYNCMEKPNG